MQGRQYSSHQWPALCLTFLDRSTRSHCSLHTCPQSLSTVIYTQLHMHAVYVNQSLQVTALTLGLPQGLSQGSSHSSWFHQDSLCVVRKVCASNFDSLLTLKSTVKTVKVTAAMHEAGWVKAAFGTAVTSCTVTPHALLLCCSIPAF